MGLVVLHLVALEVEEVGDEAEWVDLDLSGLFLIKVVIKVEGSMREFSIQLQNPGSRERC
jgi:hypothetical protein